MANQQLPRLDFNGLSEGIGFGSGQNQTNVLDDYQLGDQISWTHGKNSVRAGFDLEQGQQHWTYYGLGTGVVEFQRFPDFLLGLSAAQNGSPTGLSNINSCGNCDIYNSTNGGVVHYFLQDTYDGFVQDDIKVSQRLTLNLGLRWEYDGLMSEKYGNYTTTWFSQLVLANTAATLGNSPATGSLVGYAVPANYSTATWGPLPAGVLRNTSNIPTSTPTPWDNFAPRGGFAYQPLASHKLVLRGGWGMFYDKINGINISSGGTEAPPYAVQTAGSGAAYAAATLAHPYNVGGFTVGEFPTRWINFNAACSVASPCSSNLATGGLNQVFITPVTYSYNLNVQYEIRPSWILETGYVGSYGIHQEQSQHFNQAALASPANPVNGVTTTTTQNASLRVPYLGMAPTASWNSTNGDYKYNSFQTTLRKQLSHGVTLQAAYTYARAFANLANSNNPLDLRQSYGLNSQYRPEVLVINYSWDLPFGHPKGFAGKIVSGWNLAGVTTMQSGTPLTITDSRGGTAYGSAGASTAQMAPGMTYANVGTTGGVIDRLGGVTGGPGYFNAAAFSTTPTGGIYGNGTGYGNSGIGIITGPGQNNWDMTLSKTTRVGGIHENATLQFRVEFFNTYNHPQFANPTTAVSSSAFGQITATSVNPRLIQLALKYVF